MEYPKLAILCGGRGRRMWPDTRALPKPLIEIAGKPILDHILEMYTTKGIREVILCVGYKSGILEKRYCGSFKNECDIVCSNAGEEASMLERIRAIADMVGDNVIVTYGDTLMDLNIDELLMHHMANGKSITIVTSSIMSPFGLVEYGQENEVRSFIEKPRLNYYIGMAVIRKAALRGIQENLLKMPDGNGLVTLFQDLAAADDLNGFRHDGFQLTFNTSEGAAEASTRLREFFTQREDLHSAIEE